MVPNIVVQATNSTITSKDPRAANESWRTPISVLNLSLMNVSVEYVGLVLFRNTVSVKADPVT